MKAGRKHEAICQLTHFSSSATRNSDVHLEALYARIRSQEIRAHNLNIVEMHLAPMLQIRLLTWFNFNSNMNK